jgi:hypothetical protein
MDPNTDAPAGGEVTLTEGKVVSAAAVTVNVCLVEGPPPGVGVKTVTWWEPAVAMAEAAIVAVSVPAFGMFVFKAVPSHWMKDEFVKLEPLAVSVKPAEPATAVEGKILLRVGAGLFRVTVTDLTALLPAASEQLTLTVLVPTFNKTAVPLAGVQVGGFPELSVAEYLITSLVADVVVPSVGDEMVMTGGVTSVKVTVAFCVKVMFGTCDLSIAV